MHRPILFNKTITMIKPIELFPGAIVEYARHTFRVYGIVERDIIDGKSYKGLETAIYLKKPNSEWEILPKNQKEINPITLTSKIVEKLGFKKIRRDDGPYSYYQKGAIEIWFLYGELDSIWRDRQIILNEPPRRKRYVHYLQRFLAEKTKVKIDFSKLLK